MSPTYRSSLSYIVSVVAVALCLASCANTPPPTPPDPPARPSASLSGVNRLALVAPADGSVVFTNRLVDVFARPEPWPEAMSLPRIDAELSVTGADGPRIVADGDLRMLKAPNQIAAFWDPRDAAPGPYTIDLTVKDGDRKLTARAKVELRDPPKASFQVEGSAPADNGILVRFIASARTAAPAEVVTYVWDFGDDTAPLVTKTRMAEHVYARIGQTVGVMLEAQDSLGGAGRTMAMLKLPDQPGSTVILQAAATCGCKKMTVIHSVLPQSSRYCAAAVPGIPGLSAVPGAVTPPCPAGQVAFTGKLGPLDPGPTLGMGFEVEAILIPGSDASLCKEGQYVMNTFKDTTGVVANPNAQPAPPAGNIVLPGPPGTPNFTFTAVASAPGAAVAAPQNIVPPVMGPAPAPNFGADDYDTPSAFKKHEGQAIRWLDLPQFPPAGAASMDSQFVSFVSGTTGTCWCHFSISRTVNAAGGAGGAGITLVKALNCVAR